MTLHNLSENDFKAALAKASLGCATTQALLEALRKTSDTLNERSISIGVGNGGGNLFVYGNYESIKAAQARMENPVGA